MFSPSKSNRKNSIVERCRKDESTRLRIRYDLFYHTFEREEGAHVWLDGKKMIMLSSNDYLGLSDHPKVIAAGKAALDQWGSSPTGSRMANGSRTYHRELEEELAEFMEKEACHIHVAGYLACMSAVEAFAQKGDTVLIDRSAHSSLWAGLGRTRTTVERFSHNKPESLREVISFEPAESPKLLVVEGVYSMEGDIGKLPEFLEIIEGKNTFMILDDAHGFGVLGSHGRGTADHFNVTEQIDIITGSMSKSLGSTGGYVCGDKNSIEFLRTHSNQTRFSAALSPCQTATARAALGLMKETSEYQERLWSNTRYYKEILKNLDLDTWTSETPAVPIILGKKEEAYLFWKKLLQKGVYANLIPPPAVPPDKIMIRTAISARHTREDLDKIGEALAFARK